MRKLKFGMLLLLCVTILAACGKKDEGSNEPAPAAATTTPAPTQASTDEAAPTPVAAAEKMDIKIAALKGPTAIGMVKQMEDAAQGLTTNNYQYTIAGTADEITTGLVKGDFDIAAVPCNMAAVLYNKTEGKVKLAGINTLGVLYVIETGDTIHSVSDLKGKTIYSTGIGTTPQYTLNYILNANGLDPEKDVTIVYKTEPTEVAAMLTEADNAIAMLPQPYVTSVMMTNDKVRIALDVAKEWEAVSTDNSSVVTGVVVVRSDFLEKNKAAFDAFMTEYQASTDYVKANVDEAAGLLEKFDIFKASVAKNAIPYCNITMLQGEEMKTKVNGYLDALYQQNPKAVGGKLPTEDFYYIP